MSTMPANAPIVRAPDSVALTPLRRSAITASVALALSLVAWGGCARPMDKPDMTLPASDLERTDDAGNDVRTIRETGDAPDGPVSPAGDVPDEPAAPADPVAQSSGSDSNPEVFATAQQAGRVDPITASTAFSHETAATAGYHTVGGVLAEVNGRPIFTDEIIEAVRKELRGQATQLPDKDSFLRRAASALKTELDQRIMDEVLRLVAERNLTRSDRERALFLATQFRVNRITAAGGSEARARRIALEEFGIPLEKVVEETEQQLLFHLFIQAVILPRAIPSAQEMREYFIRHRAEFSGQGKGEIDFLLIEIGADGSGSSPEQLQGRAEQVHRRAVAGEDFAALAAEHNDNPAYNAGGAVPGAPLGRGDFRWPAVDAAVWSTAEGEVTPIIAEDGGGRLFIGKVIGKTDPEAIGFDQAQQRILQIIRQQRVRDLQMQYVSEAQQYAAITPVEQIDRNLQTALEVVAEHYEAWRAE